MDKLADPRRKPTIVILGGSNAAFGYDTKLLNDSLEMPVFNAGLHAGMGMKFFLDDCSQYLKKGDVLVFSPEYDQFYGNLNDGQSEMTDAFYLYHCHYPGEMSYKQIIGVIQNTPSYLRKKIEYNLFALANLKTDPVYTLSSVNKYGDVTWHWYHTRAHSAPDGRGLDCGSGAFNESAFTYLVAKQNELKHKGVTIVMYPAAFEQDAFKGSVKSIEYISKRLRLAGFPYICAPRECSFPKNDFYDTNYHLNHQGALLHNKHLIKFLKKKKF
ncbi:hypothetical protein KSW89_09305 [Prevotella copri]|uniref:SGNH/GDSL hydrolase family protein n=1 Tax=Segatella copri TaxID=165179 RepID=A0AAW4N8Q2_9BACT|nr:hypothetical protein [Segatella copri]MBU9911387.1 hypothetical protein [Segatella copri]MBV3399106.1 hypothetical protein [Segatella copri]MBV3408734.1 hypothetical protein [Segatella copri]MBV3411597.1 hypothetical protein [Segatella copri]MBV3420061.1 hypothetical protein [Segatella copri]